MKVQIVKMFKDGIKLERRMLSDRYSPVVRGTLTIAEETNQGRHRPTKIARLVKGFGSIYELFDVQLVWLNDQRMTLTGDERSPTADGKTVCYRQSWLVMLDIEPATSHPAPGR